jgi:hypothetical protein
MSVMRASPDWQRDGELVRIGQFGRSFGGAGRLPLIGPSADGRRDLCANHFGDYKMSRQERLSP